MTDDFAPDGQLAKAIPGFKPREPQRQMAVAVTRAIEKGQPLVVEAGTGTGKTYAYGPCAAGEKESHYLDRFKSVAGSALQPRFANGFKGVEIYGQRGVAERALKLPLPRTSRTAGAGGGRSAGTNLKRCDPAALWSNQTVDGDISTCVSVAEDSQAWPLVTSTNDNCLGSDCPMYKDCFVVKARKKRWTPMWWW